MYDPKQPYNDLPLLPPDIHLSAQVYNKAIKANKALAELKGIADIIPNQSIILNTLILREAKDSSEIENIFTTQDDLYRAFSAEKEDSNSAVKEVCRLWGAPDFRGECTDPNFPSWSSANEIAFWPKNGGFAFVEIRDFHAVVNEDKSIYCGIATGWRPDKENSKLIVEYRWVGPPPK